MKSLVVVLVVASTAMVSSLSFAQPTSGPTRAEVRSQSACGDHQWQQGQQGLTRSPTNSSADKTSAMNCDSSGSGPAMNGSAQAGAPMGRSANPTLFRHH